MSFLFFQSYRALVTICLNKVVSSKSSPQRKPFRQSHSFIWFGKLNDLQTDRIDSSFAQLLILSNPHVAVFTVNYCLPIETHSSSFTSILYFFDPTRLGFSPPALPAPSYFLLCLSPPTFCRCSPRPFTFSVGVHFLPLRAPLCSLHKSAAPWWQHPQVWFHPFSCLCSLSSLQTSYLLNSCCWCQTWSSSEHDSQIPA